MNKSIDMSAPTPETDASEEHYIDTNGVIVSKGVPANICRKIERERDYEKRRGDFFEAKWKQSIEKEMIRGFIIRIVEFIKKILGKK